MKKTGFVLLTISYLLCFSLILSGCMREANKSYDMAISLYFDGKTEQAVKKAETSLSQGKKDAETHALLALLYEELGDDENASLHKDFARVSAEKTLTTWKYLGIYELKGNRIEEAKGCFRNALSISDDPECHAYLGDIYYNEGYFEEAIAEFNDATCSGYHTAYHDMMIGLSYLQMNQVYASTQYFDLLPDKQDIEPSWYVRIVQAYNEKKEHAMSDKYFNAGLLLFDTDDQFEMTKGEYFLLCGKLSDAVESFSGDEDARSAFLGARYYMQIGEYEEAENLFQKAIMLDPENPMISAGYMTLKILTGDETAALQLMTEIQSSDHEEAKKQAMWNRIILYEMQEDYKNAYEELLSFMKVYGGDDMARREEAFLSRIQKGY